ncbi:MAG: GNAT family N-acetyltransferase [Hyphomicrobiales bacterium]|nr:GNAT family N-acetyltransferase [Hyphomicrobiales bacterium]
MIQIITGKDIKQYPDAMEQAYRLRHRVFVEEMGWEDLRRPDEREFDQFDDEHAVHMFAFEGTRVVGYQRMLPTTRQHLLSAVLRDLCDGPVPSGADTWEWTRYCVTKEFRERGRMLSPVASKLLLAIVEWGLAAGVDKITIEMNPLWLLRLVQLHFMVSPLGLPRQIGKSDCLAVVAKFDVRTLERLREVAGIQGSVLVAADAGNVKTVDVKTAEVKAA